MKRIGQHSRQVDSAVGVMRTLVHILQIMQRREVTKYLPKLGRNERGTPTIKERWVESKGSVTLKWRAETMRQH